MAGRFLERLVGPQSALPYTGFCAHHPRADLTMEGGTTFHFVTDGPEAALARARDAAKGKDIRIGGGVSVLRQYLALKLIDEMHLAVSPVLLGEGEHLFGGLDLLGLGYVHGKTAPGDGALHVAIRKKQRTSSAKNSDLLHVMLFIQFSSEGNRP